MPEESGRLLPTAAAPNEPLARYVTHKKQYRIHPRPSAKATLFEPRSDLRLSVFRITGLDGEQVRKMGQDNVVRDTSLKLHGCADIAVSDIKNVDPHLNIDCDGIPARHACIVGWPVGDEKKSERMLIAYKLADKATLILYA